MRPDNETLKKLSAVSEVKMSSQKQQEIWDNIEKEVDQTNPAHKKRSSNVWGTSAAAVAAIAILAGGYYAVSTHFSPSTTINQQNTTASYSVTHPHYPSLSDIQSVTVWGNNPPWEDLSTQDPNAVERQILGWLESSSLYSGTVPEEQPIGGGDATIPYLGSAQLILHLQNKNINITPAFYVTNESNGTTQVNYVANVVRYIDPSVNGGRPFYLTSPKLYTWLKNDAWKAEFAPQTNTQTTSPYSSRQLAALTAQQLANYNVQHHEALPFAGWNVTRSVPTQQLLVSNPKSGSMNPPSDIKGATTLNPNDFYVIDRWSLTIPGNNNGIAVEVDKKTDSSLYLIGIANGPRATAFSFNKQPYITNFTGSYIVFATPNPAQGNPFYAINVQTGALVSGQTAYEMSTDYGTMGGASGDIQGLSQSFSSLP